MNILKTIAKNLRLRRSELGLTQSDVAKKMNIARQNYGVYETGENEIKVTKLQKMANILEIDIVELLKEKEQS